MTLVFPITERGVYMIQWWCCLPIDRCVPPVWRGEECTQYSGDVVYLLTGVFHQCEGVRHAQNIVVMLFTCWLCRCAAPVWRGEVFTQDSGDDVYLLTVQVCSTSMKVCSTSVKGWGVHTLQWWCLPVDCAGVFHQCEKDEMCTRYGGNVYLLTVQVCSTSVEGRGVHTTWCRTQSVDSKHWTLCNSWCCPLVVMTTWVHCWALCPQ